MSGITDLRKFNIVMAFAWIAMGIVSGLALGWDGGYWGLAIAMSGVNVVMAAFNQLVLGYYVRGEDEK